MENDNQLAYAVALAIEKNNQVEMINLVDRVTDYCIENENGEVFDGWDREIIRIMIAYHIAKDTCIIDIGEDGTIHGVVMWYNCNSSDGWNFVKNWEMDRPYGDAIFIAFLFSDGPDSLKKLCANFIVREPSALRKQIIGLRYRKGVPHKVKYRNSVFKKVLNLK